MSTAYIILGVPVNEALLENWNENIPGFKYDDFKMTVSKDGHYLHLDMDYGDTVMIGFVRYGQNNVDWFLELLNDFGYSVIDEYQLLEEMEL